MATHWTARRTLSLSARHSPAKEDRHYARSVSEAPETCGSFPTDLLTPTSSISAKLITDSRNATFSATPELTTRQSTRSNYDPLRRRSPASRVCHAEARISPSTDISADSSTYSHTTYLAKSSDYQLVPTQTHTSPNTSFTPPLTACCFYSNLPRSLQSLQFIPVDIHPNNPPTLQNAL